MSDSRFTRAIHTFMLFRSIVFFSTAAMCSSAALAQDITANIYEGCAPLIVKFSTDAQGTYAWTFGKTSNNTSNLMQPDVTYDSPGVYTVSLSVNGAQPIVKTGIIKVYAPPSPDFEYQYTPGCPPVDITLINKATSTPQVPITSYQWVFGDGSDLTTGSTADIHHTYNLGGDKTISLLTKNDNLPGCISTKTETGIRIYDIQAKFTTTNFFCSVPASAQFTNNSTGPGQLSYLWDFGGGATSTLASPSYTFSGFGTYNVKLTVSGDFNCTASTSQAIVVGTTSFAIVTDTDVICEGGEINFDVSQGAFLNSWTWDFGNGDIPQPTLAQRVKYSTAGTYTVKLAASSGACTSLLTKKITVLTKPAPDFAITAECDRVIAFNNQSSNSSEWIWDFGDGATSQEKNPQHSFSSEGSYMVKLKAINPGCAIDGDPEEVKVYSNPVVSILPNETINCTDPSLSGCAPFEVDFGYNTTTGIPINSVQWEFGDGRKSEQTFPKIVYSNPGTYSVKLTATANGGCTSVAQVTVNVFDQSKVTIPGISVESTNVCVGQEITIKANPASAYPLCWEVQPGIFKTGNEFKYHFTLPGTQDIKLKVPGCSIEKTFVAAVTVREPKVDFAFLKYCRDPNDPNAPTPYQVDFVNNSSDKSGLSYLWDFGDGTTSTERNPPRHNYPVTPNESKSYAVALNVVDPSSHCSVVVAESFTIQEVVADFSVRGVPAGNADLAKSIKACKNDEIAFTDNSQLATYWLWYFDDQTVSKFDRNSEDQNPKWTFKTAGNYGVTLTVSDGTCGSTKQLTIPISVADIEGKFSFSAQSTCSELAVQFSDKSVAAPPVTTWLWDFGNGDFSADQNPLYTYRTKGRYNIALKVGNANGECTVPQKGGLLFTNPMVDFTVSRPFACIGENIVVSSTTQYTNSVYWDFGNGETSTSFIPVISYSQTGAYPVFVRAKDLYGCEVTQEKSNFITITKPTADFIYDKTIKDCPPLVTSFADKSADAAKLLWSFGDGQTANVSNPINTYLYPGIYTVSLQVQDQNGCLDTKTIPDLVKLDGPTGTFTNRSTFVCTDDTVRFSSSYKDAVSVQWDFGDGSIEQNLNDMVTHVYTVKGKVQPLVILKDSKGCEVIYKTDREMQVNKTPKSDFSFSPKFPFEGEQVRFVSDTVGLEFTWSFADGDKYVTDTLSRIFASGSQVVTLASKDVSSGCASITEKEIDIQGYPTLIPNVFTPNSDQWNQNFEIIDLEKSDWKLIVYNRWGGLVYQNDHYHSQWNGGDLSSGTYYFKLQNNLRNEKYFSGYITIIR